MQKVSELYDKIVSGKHWFESRVTIGEAGVLVDSSGDAITFGGARIRIGGSGPDAGYGENMLVSVTTKRPLFDEVDKVGRANPGEITVEMLRPSGVIPKRALVAPFIRASNGEETSEWIPKGKFYIDKRSESDFGDRKKLSVHGYDGMLYAEADYPPSGYLDWPAQDVDVVQEIADYLGFSVDSRVYQIMTSGYLVQYPSRYSCREVLGYIGSMYAGSFIMNDNGELMLVTLYGLPPETRYLIVGNGDGSAITFGGDRILV